MINKSFFFSLDRPVDKLAEIRPGAFGLLVGPSKAEAALVDVAKDGCDTGNVDKATLAVVHPHPRFVMGWISWCSHPLLDGRRECSRLITEEEI